MDESYKCFCIFILKLFILTLRNTAYYSHIHTHTHRPEGKLNVLRFLGQPLAPFAFGKTQCFTVFRLTHTFIQTPGLTRV